MEALVVIVAELAALVGLAALIVVIGLAASSVALIITASAGRRPLRLGVRRIRQVLVASVVIAGLALLALQTFALRPALEWGLGRLATSHGYQLSLGGAELSLLRGGLRVDELELRCDRDRRTTCRPRPRVALAPRRSDRARAPRDQRRPRPLRVAVDQARARFAETLATL